MGPEDLNEKREWEVRRVACAFGVEDWSTYNAIRNARAIDCYGLINDISIYWMIDKGSARVWDMEIGDYGLGCRVFVDERYTHPDGREWWSLSEQPEFHDLMARALYRLGFEEQSVLSQLPELTAHEKLELRLSMPHEFWPQKWLEEEAK